MLNLINWLFDLHNAHIPRAERTAHYCLSMPEEAEGVEIARVLQDIQARDKI